MLLNNNNIPMKIKNLLKIFGFLIGIFLIFYINLATSNNCKTFKIFKSFADLGFSHLDSCYSNKNLLPKTKLIYCITIILISIIKTKLIY